MEEKDGGNAVAELLVQRLVVPHLHACPRPDAAAEYGQQQEGGFAYAPLGSPGLPFVQTIGEERRDVDGREVDEDDAFHAFFFRYTYATAAYVPSWF